MSIMLKDLTLSPQRLYIIHKNGKQNKSKNLIENQLVTFKIRFLEMVLAHDNIVIRWRSTDIYTLDIPLIKQEEMLCQYKIPTIS